MVGLPRSNLYTHPHDKVLFFLNIVFALEASRTLALLNILTLNRALFRGTPSIGLRSGAPRPQQPDHHRSFGKQEAKAIYQGSQTLGGLLHGLHSHIPRPTAKELSRVHVFFFFFRLGRCSLTVPPSARCRSFYR